MVELVVVLLLVFGVTFLKDVRILRDGFDSDDEELEELNQLQNNCSVHEDYEEGEDVLKICSEISSKYRSVSANLSLTGFCAI